MIGSACAKGRAESSGEVAVEAVGLGKGILPYERAKCCLVQPVLDLRGDRTLAVLCCFNKRASGDLNQSALFSQLKFTLNDM